MIRISRSIPVKKIKLVIFDLDGTLIDSEHDLAAAVNAMLVNYGRKELPLDVIGTYIGDGAPMLIRRALGDPSDRDFLQEALNFFLAYYREHKLDTTYAYEGIQQALKDIGGTDGASRKLAVLTNKPVRASRDILAGLGLAGSFFQVYGGNSFDTKKPDPFGANTLIKEAGGLGGGNGHGRRFAGRHPDRSQRRPLERRRDLWLRATNAGAGCPRRAGGHTGRTGKHVDGEHVAQCPSLPAGFLLFAMDSPLCGTRRLYCRRSWCGDGVSGSRRSP